MEFDLKDEFQFFIENQDELVEKYYGKFIVLKGHKVVDVYDNEVEAYFASLEKFGLGKFIIQQCLPGKDIYTQSFNSRAVFV